MRARVTFIIHGDVQGVSLRYFTAQRARRLKLSGWVTNAADGDVHVVAEGEKQNIEQLKEWFLNESPGEITGIDEKWSEPKGLEKDFIVRYEELYK